MVVHTAYLIAPPPPGDYVITLNDESTGFEYEVNLTVEAPQVIEPGAPVVTEAQSAPVELGHLNG